MMRFNVTKIEFDFGTDTYKDESNAHKDFYYEVSPDEADIIEEDNLGIWDAYDENDLIEQITEESGWCINSIDYQTLKHDATL